MTARTAKYVLLGMSLVMMLIVGLLIILGITLQIETGLIAMIVYPFMFICTVTMVFITVRYVRCPNCGKSLTREGFGKLICTACGEKL